MKKTLVKTNTKTGFKGGSVQKDLIVTSDCPKVPNCSQAPQTIYSLFPHALELSVKFTNVLHVAKFSGQFFVLIQSAALEATDDTYSSELLVPSLLNGINHTLLTLELWRIRRFSPQTTSTLRSLLGNFIQSHVSKSHIPSPAFCPSLYIQLLLTVSI